MGKKAPIWNEPDQRNGEVMEMKNNLANEGHMPGGTHAKSKKRRFSLLVVPF